MELPERDHYFLAEVADRLGCSIKDLIHHGAAGRLKIAIFLSATENVKVYSFPKHSNCSGPERFIEDHCSARGIFYLDQETLEDLQFQTTKWFHAGPLFPLPGAKTSGSFYYPEEEAFGYILYEEALDFDQLLITSEDLKQFLMLRGKSEDEKITRYPFEIQAAILTYQEFWESLPEDKHPGEDDIYKFIDGLYQDKLNRKAHVAEKDRIKKISTPDENKKGGAPRKEMRPYTGRSKEKG